MGPRSRPLFVAVALVSLLAGLALAWRQASMGPATSGATAVLFAHTFNDAEGAAQPVAQWRGQWLVVNFWATWCAPCVEEMPELERVHVDYRARGVTVIGLGIDSPAAIRGFRNQLKLTLPLLVAGTDGTILARELGNPSGALPYTVLIDPQGRVVQARLGRIKEAELRGWLNPRLTGSADPATYPAILRAFVAL